MPVETFNKMRKSNCQLCDGFGVVTCVNNGHEYVRACNCTAGAQQNMAQFRPYKDRLLYALDFELTDKETEIYNSLRKGKRAVDLCPF